MLDFWRAVGTQPLALNAVLAALLLSVACGTVGTYVVVRRITYIAAGVAHCVLGGMGAARYLQVAWGWHFFHPLYGALASAFLAAAVIGWVSMSSREREDSAISAVWSVGMALGVIFIYLTPGYTTDLMGYLFGNILLVSRYHLYFILLLDLTVVSLILYRFKEFEAVCFDEEFARTRNINVRFIYILLLAVTALTVVALSMIVGIVLVIALLTLPAAIAARVAGSIAQMMLLATFLCAACCLAGLTLSFAPDLPAGPVIIILAGALYVLTVGAAWLRQRFGGSGSRAGE
ncbi:MAG: High-affinity zinc uptake system membrane protein ZnuB [Candidatus Hydrogenedentes bacterium ADurb.Bin179]|nr:MAG: High-affinity zinc uptake system membrane protein ZnuB [Candidatus Hydrogenedentes bacterium ADurb.Bin179]